MRLLTVTQHYAPEQNAPALRWRWLASSFAERGHEVEVVTATWTEARVGVEADEQVRVHRLGNVIPGTGIKQRLINEAYFAAKTLRTVWKLPRPDVIIVSAPPLGSVPLAAILKWTLRRPLVLEMRDTWPELLSQWREWSDHGAGPVKRPRAMWLVGVLSGPLQSAVRRVQDHAALVVTTADDYAAQIGARTGRRVLCIRNTHHEVPTIPGRTESDRLRVLYLGNVGRAQHLATAIEAASIVRSKGGSMRLRIVGSGVHLRPAKTLARRLNAPVEFIAKTDHKQIGSQYAWADSVLVLLRDWPSMSQTVPSKLYEAIATGRHISASLAGEAARIVREAGAGDIVPPKCPQELAELWLGLIADPTRVQGARHRRWLEENADSQRLADRYLDALQDIVDARRGIS